MGASAGGLDALQEFLGRQKRGGGAAFIIAQHLSPDHPSLIVDLLSRATELPVVEAVDGGQLAADVIMVGPPNRDVTIVGDRLSLAEPALRTSPSPSIDLLFDSLAEHWGPRAVAVVLSGTGSDGAHGLRSVRGAGGLAMVQSPRSARFDGMPRAALSLGSVDVVAGAGSLGERIVGLAQGAGAWVGEDQPSPGGDALPAVTARLRRSVGIDFSEFKQSTLRRQIQRRMAIREVTDLDAYLAVLVHDDQEARALADNLLVTVTSFFRDPGAFEALRAELTTSITRPDLGEVVRVWVPGCATGEEVYSIAMLIAEILGRPADLDRRLKVFGTDLDERSLSVARRAVYPESAVTHIPPPLRAAYLKQTEAASRSPRSFASAPSSRATMSAPTRRSPGSTWCPAGTPSCTSHRSSSSVSWACSPSHCVRADS